jgi:L-alanine-DL-glutamate epimerase-like enolase superfamily enzyme
MLTLLAGPISWKLREPFVIARGSAQTADGILVILIDEQGYVGRGEAYGVGYRGETPKTMLAQIQTVAERIRAGIDRRELLQLLPAGGARCAIDSALWDIDAKRSEIPAWTNVGGAQPHSVTSAVTIGIAQPEQMRQRALRLSSCPLLKVKTDAKEPLAGLRAVRRAAPNAAIILDPNASWSVDLLRRALPELQESGVVLIEQPLSIAEDASLTKIEHLIPICADESLHDVTDLDRVAGRYDVVNIKLDKTGGLTAALELAQTAKTCGLKTMVGCMWGSSLAMAPAAILAQSCEFVDLDGPLLQIGDHRPAITYRSGVMAFPDRALWG